MRIHRFIGNFNFNKNKLSISDAGFYNQIKNVLRLKIGEHIVLCDGALNEALVKIMGIGKNTIDVEVAERMKNKNEPTRRVTLYCSILKRENFELVVQKATELGVAQIIPLICRRTVKLDFRKERLEKVIKEAAEQSGRGMLPVLHEPLKFEEALMQTKDTLNLFFDSSGIGIENWKLKIKNYARGVWVGPEGGWDESELEKAKTAKLAVVSLGALTLRAETAAIVASYIGVARGQFL